MRKETQRREQEADYYMPEQGPRFTWRHWAMVMAGIIVLVFLGVILHFAGPFLGWWAPFIAGSLGATVTIGIPAAVIGLGLHFWHNATLKNLQTRTLKPNQNGAYGAIYEGNGSFAQPKNAELPIGVNVPHEYSPQIHNHNDVRELVKLMEMARVSVTEEKPPQIGDYMPEPYTMSSVLSGWQPSKSGILLARKEGLITVPIGEPLCHTTFTGNTDAGKTNDQRGLLIQLLFLEQIAYLCDRNYQRFRLDSKNGTVYDYSPIEARLALPPITNARQCLAFLREKYSGLEDRRIARRKAIVRFKDEYIVMDELPAFCGDEPEIMQYVGRFLRESRQYGIFFIVAAQDLLNNTLKNDNGAVRDNLLTNYYGGGDMTTARMVLNLEKGEQIDERGLGKLGVKYLRAKGSEYERYVKCRTPLSDDQATFTLLGAPKQGLPDIVESDNGYEEPEPTARYQTGPLVRPVMPVQPRRATLYDAAQVWNEVQDINLGRVRMRELLQAKGLECSDDLARTLLANIRGRLEK